MPSLQFVLAQVQANSRVESCSTNIGGGTQQNIRSEKRGWHILPGDTKQQG